MTPYEIRWTEPAIRDLSDIRTWIAADESLTAERVARSLTESVDKLQSLPFRGRPDRVAGTRELVLAGWPWIVVYEVTDETVTVLRVLYGFRMP